MARGNRESVMSMGQILWALKAAPVESANEYAVLACLAEHADQDGCNAFPSQATIVKRTRLSPRSVARCLKSLEARGLIARGNQSIVSVRAKFLPANLRPVLYDVMVPCSWWSDTGRLLKLNAWRAAEGLSPISAANRPDLTDPDAVVADDIRIDGRPARKAGLPGWQASRTESHASETVEACPSDMSGMPVRQTTSPRTHPEDPPSSERRSSQPSPSPDGEDEDLFDVFWSVYPRKVGKLEARKAWRNATRTAPPLVVLDGARRFADDPNLPPPTFITHPANWLKRGSWGDEPLPPRLTGGGAPPRRGYDDRQWANRDAALVTVDTRSLEEIFGIGTPPSAVGATSTDGVNSGCEDAA